MLFDKVLCISKLGLEQEFWCSWPKLSCGRFSYAPAFVYKAELTNISPCKSFVW